MVTSAAPFIPQTILLQNAPYKAEDFWMVNLPSRDVTLAATATGKPINTIDDVVAALKRDPRSLTLGVQPASADFINVALFLAGHGIDRSRARIVTYADGGGPARTATVGGHVDVGFVGAEGFLPLAERIRPLMVFSDERNEGFPEAAVWAEHARANNIAPEFVEGSQRGFVVLRRFVERVPDRYKILETAIERTTKDPECIAAMKGQQLATTWYGPEASNRAYLNAFNTMQKYVDLLRQA
jgi:tripartite-type tricarboxylate transporter receptor subunit TctC